MVGFNCKNVTSIDKRFICFKCHLIYRQPVQLIGCEHRYCNSCFPPIRSGSPIICEQCHRTVATNEIRHDTNFDNDLGNLSILCSFCSWKGHLRYYSIHLSQAHSVFICEHCAEQCDSVETFTSHRQLQCSAIPIWCSLKDYGCIQTIPRGQIKDHYHTAQHYQAMIAAISHLKGQTLILDESIIDAIDLPESNFQSTSDMTHLLKDALQTMKDDNQRLQEESYRCESVSEVCCNRSTELKLSIEDTNSMVEATKLNVSVLEQELLSLRETMNNRQSVSYDGTFIWKITGIHEKLMDAQSERQTSVYSPPFYSSPTGYKMRARAYMNGDGHARRTHMSLFFVLMRSVNDHILKYPFEYKVTFCLYDQTPAQRHIVDSFRPDIRSNSFQQPKSEMNIASGIPKFVPLEMIEREDSPYVQNDTMFIKIMVDFDNTPKTLMPFIISLDPGLPIHVQQTMIKEEAERRGQ